ncbi:MAG: MerR family DNA-binding transcriptional regulator [Candidatus Accumulibacter sp.]|jgi:DNA-binding transcriptional MerR regulator|nr:MerR family DNA-binding transcriptional regulator [Accumulibacter sp.]
MKAPQTGGARADNWKTGDLISAREFSRITNIPVSTLRYYDDIGLFTPVLRGENNYRYYAPQQIVTVKFILVLIDCGVPLKTIREFEATRTPQSLATLLHDQQLQMDREMARLLANRSVLDVALKHLATGLLADENAVTVQRLAAASIRLGAENEFKSGDYLFYRAYIRFIRETPHINFNYPVGGLFTDFAHWHAKPSEPARFFSVDPLGSAERPAGTYLVGYARGYYGETNDLPGRMADYAKKHRLEFRGPVYNIHVQSEISVKDPDQYLMQASVQVRKRA